MIEIPERLRYKIRHFENDVGNYCIVIVRMESGREVKAMVHNNAVMEPEEEIDVENIQGVWKYQGPKSYYGD